MAYSLADRLNWDLVERSSREQEPMGTFDIRGRPEYRAIRPLLLGVESRVLLVGINSEGSRAGWKLGAWATQRLLISPSSTTIFPSQPKISNRFFCQLNTLTLIEFPDWNESPYLLELDIPFWLTQITFEIWQYSGPMNDTYVEINVDQSTGG